MRVFDVAGEDGVDLSALECFARSRLQPGEEIHDDGGRRVEAKGNFLWRRRPLAPDEYERIARAVCAVADRMVADDEEAPEAVLGDEGISDAAFARAAEQYVDEARHEVARRERLVAKIRKRRILGV